MTNNLLHTKFHFPNNTIEPLPKVSEQHIIERELKVNENLLNKIEASITESKKIQKANHKELSYKQYIKNYIEESCTDQVCKECLSIENCINCILKHNGITYLKLDDTIIYSVNNNANNFIFITEHDLLYRLPKIFNSNKNILSQFNISPHLINNIKSYIWRIGPQLIYSLDIDLNLNRYFEKTQLAILSFFLFPAHGIFNSIAYQRARMTLDTTPAINQQQTITTPDQILLSEINTLSSGSVSPYEILNTSKETIEQMRLATSRFFNKSIKSFLETTLLWNNPSEIANITRSIESNLPKIIETEPSLQGHEILWEISRILLFSKEKYLFNLFPPTKELLTAIFYYHQKFLSESHVQNYSPIINTSTKKTYDIRYLAAQKILHKTITPKEALAQNKDYSAIRSNIFSMLSIDPSIPSPSNLNPIYKDMIAKAHIDKTAFLKLRRILFHISNGDIHSLTELLLLIGKIYLGKKSLEFFDAKNQLLTIIECSNPEYIKKFLSDIMLSEATTYHTSKSLKAELIPILIFDKLNSTLVNIDSSESSCSDLSFFKKLTSGNKVSLNNSPLPQIFHKNTTHHLYITSNPDNQFQKQPTNIPYKKITLTGNISDCIYQPLDTYESIFMAIASIYYTIDVYTNHSLPPIEFPITNKNLPEANIIEKFLSSFCIDQTDKLDPNALSPIKTNDLDNTKKHTALIKELGIDQLDYSTKIDLHHAFSLWYKATYQKKSSISVDDFTNELVKKYHPIFYKKRSSIEIYSGEKHEARGFYGLSIKVEELNSYIERQQSIEKQTAKMQQQKNCTQFIETLINKYEPILFGIHNTN